MIRKKASAILVLHRLPGRLRLHWPEAASLAAWLSKIEGVQSMEPNRRTGNVLIRFDPARLSEETLLGKLAQAMPGPDEVPPAQETNTHPLLRAGLRGVLGHALADTVFYVLVFSEPFGLPLAGLGVLHLCFDVIAWSFAAKPLWEAAVQSPSR
jgi:hypothetical protein